MQKKIVLATRNPSKVVQIQALFLGSRFSVISLDEAGVKGEGEEDGRTLRENASKKAWFAHNQLPDLWTMADDTGLFIYQLDGAPGIYPARWAGEGKTTEEITQYCLKRMEGLTDRSALFKTEVVIVSPDGKEYGFIGKISGHMLEAARSPAQPKMPYSPLFVPEGETRAWAEMSTEEENAISHRGIAFRRARAFLESLPHY